MAQATPFNFGESLVDVTAASLGFALSLSLNEALKLSFDALLKPESTRDTSGLLPAWIYALCMFVTVLTLLFVLLGCLRPAASSLFRKTACSGTSRFVVPLTGFALLATIVLVSSAVTKKKYESENAVNIT
jgi:hypothetical protein